MALPTITVKDASGANVVINTTPNGGQQVSANALPVVIASDQSAFALQLGDGVTSATKATVAQFHNADNQNIGTGNGLLTGGVAQLLNSSGNLDRQRETGSDVITNNGVATGTQQLAWPVILGPVTSGAITGSASPQSITLTAASGTTNGVQWVLQVGQTIVLDPNLSTQEAFVITAVNTGTKVVTGVIKNNHVITATASAFFLDQGRSAMIPDGSTGQGIAAGGTYLFNSSLNSGNGGWEAERSAKGELDGATGTGTNIAADYKWNSNGPANATNFASGMQFDRVRALQGKGVNTATQSSGGAAGATSITVSSAAAANSLNAGQQIRIDRNTGTEETAYVSTTYVSGTAAITLQSPLAFTHSGATVEWDVFASGGPGLSGFTAAGISLEEEALYNPVDGKYYIERSATQDAMAAANIVAESPALFNGATMDRQRTPFVFKTLNAVVITSETTIWTPTAGKKFRLMGGMLSYGVASGNVTLKDNTAGSTILILPTNTVGVAFSIPPIGNGILSGTINNVLTATGASTQTISGFIFGTEE